MVDLGHVTLGNVSDWSSSDNLGMGPNFSEDDDEDGKKIILLIIKLFSILILDDLFQTPPSSPPSETEWVDSGPRPLIYSVQSDSSTSKRQGIDPYQRYLLRLSDLQVCVMCEGCVICEGWVLCRC